jgi:hypothetical protein
MRRRLNMATGEIVAIGQSRESSSFSGIDASGDGSLLAARHPHTSQIELFDATTLRPVGRPITTGDATLVPAFTPDGNLIAEGLPGVSSWNLDPDVWQDEACRAVGRNLTRAEWVEYLGDEVYRATCPEWPPAD